MLYKELIYNIINVTLVSHADKIGLLETIPRKSSKNPIKSTFSVYLMSDLIQTVHANAQIVAKMQVPKASIIENKLRKRKYKILKC